MAVLVLVFTKFAPTLMLINSVLTSVSTSNACRPTPTECRGFGAQSRRMCRCRKKGVVFDNHYQNESERMAVTHRRYASTSTSALQIFDCGAKTAHAFVFNPVTTTVVLNEGAAVKYTFRGSRFTSSIYHNRFTYLVKMEASPFNFFRPMFEWTLSNFINMINVLIDRFISIMDYEDILLDINNKPLGFEVT